jgi:threonine/homoserine/homoserine lactone efflux protein
MDIAAATLSFAAVAGLLTIVPGLDTALVLRAAVTGGRGHGFATALGIGTGTLIWGAAAAAGVSALLTASHLAYTLLRVAGAIYLVYLGVTTLWNVWRSRRHAEPSETADAAPTGGLVRAWARGTTTNLLNPKVGVFYAAMIPQFIPDGVPHLPMGLLLALVHNVGGMVWFSLIIYGTHLARTWLSRPSVKHAVQTLTGTALLGLGLKLALSRGPA